MMYRIVVVGLKQVFEAEYYKAYATFYDFVRSTDYDILLYNDKDILLCSGYTGENGNKICRDLTREAVKK